MLKYFDLIHLKIYLIVNYFLIIIKKKNFRKIFQVFLLIPSLKLVVEISEFPCSLRIFLTNATFDDSIIFAHKCSINCRVIERCLK